MTLQELVNNAMEYDVRVFVKGADEAPEHSIHVFLWSKKVALQRSEMGFDGDFRLRENFNNERIEYYLYEKDYHMPLGAIFVGTDCEDLHFGKVPMMLGMFCQDNPKGAKKLYKAALSDLREKGYNRMVKTMRVSEKEYRTSLVEF